MIPTIKKGVSADGRREIMIHVTYHALFNSKPIFQPRKELVSYGKNRAFWGLRNGRTHKQVLVITRLIVHAVFLTYLGLSILDIRNPDAVILTAGLSALILVRFRSVRCQLLRSLKEFRAFRLLDLVLWNVLFTFLLLEGLLATADWVTRNPLLMAPNARSQERIERYKDSLEDRSDADPRNSQGFNDTEWAIPKPEHTLRIVALGDSFAFGIVGYKENFLTLLERGLKQRIGKTIEVANLGLPALEPIDYLEILNSEGQSLEPDLTLLCVFSGNDFVRTARGSLLRFRNTRTFSVSWRLYRLAIEQQRRGRTDNIKTTHILDASGSVSATGNLSLETYLEVAEEYLPVLEKVYSRETQEEVDDTLGVLEEIAARAGPKRLLIAVLPSEVQVNASLRKQVCERTGIPEHNLDLFRPGRLVSEHCGSRGVVVIDLLSTFVEAEVKSRTYLPQNSHWNVYGNQVAASAILHRLEPTVRRLLEKQEYP